MHKGETLDDVIIWSCPWCDKPQGTLVEVSSHPLSPQYGWWQVRCNNCQTSGPSCDKRFDAIKAWNCLSGRIATARK